MPRKVNQPGRSKGEIQHVRLYHYELNSQAYRGLSCVARALYRLAKEKTITLTKIRGRTYITKTEADRFEKPLVQEDAA